MAGRTPSFSEPRMSADQFHSRTMPTTWSNFDARSGLAQHANVNPHPRPGPGPHPRPGPGPHPNWYHGNWHDHWNHPWNYWPAGWWGAGFVAGAAFDAALTPWSWGYWPYYNPYCAAPVVVDGATIDYSQPIVLAAEPAANVDSAATPDQTSPDAAQATSAEQAMQLLDAARNAFVQGDYASALSQCDQAIAKQPSDTVLHEFRGLALFAQQRYQEAAGAVYAVLSVGPGWDWTTLSSLYPDVDTYTKQLRALEESVKSNRNAADTRFLLAYHYLTCGYSDAAERQLQAAVQLNPKDQLSAQLLSALKTTDTAAQPAPSAPSAPAKPITASALSGDWTAQRADGIAITLHLAADGKYAWKVASEEKTQEFSGPYSVADNLLILKKGDTPVMIGQVSMLPNDRFNFKLPGDNPNDPGLTFGK
jgi:tetratricopeptide (TPR) repeat protein